jgi:putative transposase
VAKPEIRGVHLKAYADGREARAGIASWVAFSPPAPGVADRTPMAVWRSGRETAVDMPPRLDIAGALPTCPQPQQQQQAILV